jgi:hypothetical protein
MDASSALLFGFQGLVGIAFVVLLIYFIARRISIKEKEDFEDRDN